MSFFLKSVEVRQPDYERVKGDILGLFKDSERMFLQGSYSREDYDAARFAVCAWADEMLLRSPWLYRNSWLKDQLQRSYYNTADAGEEFFIRLDAIGLHQRDVREVYYLCLTQGFTGRYCQPGDGYQLEQVRTSTLKLLLGSSVGLPSLERSDLFPEAYSAEAHENMMKGERSLPRLLTGICLAGPVLLFGILYFIYRFTLGGVGDNVLRMVAN